MSDDLHEPNEPNQPADVDQDPGVEYVPEDDAIIGVAFKWSVLVIVLLGSLGLVFFLLYRGGGEESEPPSAMSSGHSALRIAFTNQHPTSVSRDDSRAHGKTEKTAASRKNIGSASSMQLCSKPISRV